MDENCKKDNWKLLIPGMIRGVKPTAKKFELDQMKIRIINNIQLRPECENVESYDILDEIEKCLRESEEQ
jgi:hypothetical protein